MAGTIASHGITPWREEERYIDFPRLFSLAQRNTRGATERNKPGIAPRRTRRR